MTTDFQVVKLAIFDVDGTLTEIKPEVLARQPGMATPNHLGEQQPLHGVVERLANLGQGGLKFALATNRGGVAWGYSSLEESEEVAQEAAENAGVIFYWAEDFFKS